MKNLLPTLWRLLNGFALSIFFGFALGAGNYYAHAEEGNDALEAAWENVLLLKHREAYRDFSIAGESLDGNARQAKFAQAVILLSLQPRTRSNIRSAEDVFQDLVDSYADDRLGLWAQYYLARIPHIHAFELDYGEAVRRYLALIRKHGLSYPGQRALCKYAILRLFVLGGD